MRTRAGCDKPVRLFSSNHVGETYSKMPECWRSCHSGWDIPTSCAPTPVKSSRMLTSCSGCGYGSGCNNVASTTLKIAVAAPIPKAMVKIAMAVKPGALRSIRRAAGILPEVVPGQPAVGFVEALFGLQEVAEGATRGRSGLLFAQTLLL